ncbi:MAG TPA: SRPBCC family protein [Calditrichia bacterium]|nr:SRPBCC family protein [Calditrichota bacterium]HQV30935.1 SRPBCC family protein [Calditrichia bacterium]
MSKVVKIAAVIAGVLAFLILVVPLFLSPTVSLKKDIEIKAPDSLVYALVSDFNRFNEWSPWYEMEPGAATSIAGEPGQVGHKYSWEGDKVGSGTMEITRVAPDSAVDILLYFREEPKPARADWKLTPYGNGVRATWYFSSEMGYPFGRIMGLMMEKFLGPDYEKGLRNLKRVAEKEAGQM